MAATAVVEQARSQAHRGADALDLGRLLDYPVLFHQAQGLAQASLEAERARHLGFGGHAQVLAFQADVPDPQASERASGSIQNRSLGHDHLRALDFGPRLFAVTSVGEERGSAVGDQQHAGASGESAQVADIGQVRDQQRVETAASSAPRHPALAAAVVHHVIG